MATVITPLKNERLRDVQRMRITRFLIPTVGASTTSVVYSVDTTSKEGILQGVRVSADPGLDFDLMVRSVESGADFSVDEILRIESISRHYQEMDLWIVFSNDDDPESTNLYIQVTNHDSGANTGNITVEFLIEAHDDTQ